MDKGDTCSFGAPISANDMYVPIARGVMRKSRRYRQWLETVIPQMQAQLRPPTRFPVDIEVTVVGGRDWHDDCDIDNALKPVVDALVKAGILPDDRARYVASCHPRFMPFWRIGEARTLVRYIEPEELLAEPAEVVVVQDVIDVQPPVGG